MFSELGARIVDTDVISHQLTQSDGDAIPRISEAFGPEFIDTHGALDRNKMRELVFADDEAKRRLENILHPLILAHTRTRVLSPTDAPYTLVVVPLLFESRRYRDWLSRVIVVDCDEATQISRTMQRGKLDEAAVRSIMTQQLQRSSRLQLADDIIRNDGYLSDLREQVKKLHSRLINL